MASPAAMPIFRLPSGGSGSDMYGFQPIGGGGTSGSNQYFPTMPSLPTPYNTPSSPGGGGSMWPQFNYGGATSQGGRAQQGFFNKGAGVAGEPPAFPVVSGNWADWLKTQIGQGMPANPLLQSLMSFFGGGQTNAPGASFLSNVANNGISALPEWQSMIGAQQQNIAQNQSNLREQFASMGDLAGSPFGTAMSNYMQQTTADQNALLGQLQQQNILQGQIPVADMLMGMFSNTAQFGQSLLPQNNPMNAFIQQLAGTYAPMYNTKSGGGILGGLMPSLMSGAGAGIAAGMGGSGAGEAIMAALAAMCHVAASFYGWGSERTNRIQFWMLTQADPDIAMFYLRNGHHIAKTPHRWKFKPLFDAILGEA